MKDPDINDFRCSVIEVFEALKKDGYNPVMQFVQYLITEDPTYITKNARVAASRIDTNVLLEEMVKNYLGKTEAV